MRSESAAAPATVLQTMLFIYMSLNLIGSGRRKAADEAKPGDVPNKVKLKSFGGKDIDDIAVHFFKKIKSVL